jgi:adenosylmethionine-8-amino-7-oxononanoate aminotransferase
MCLKQLIETLQAHPAACAAALVVQKVIERDNLLENVRQMGSVLGDLLRSEIGHLPLVGEIRGRGLFWAAEFMLHAADRIPLPRELKFCDRVVKRSLELGLNVLGNLGVTGDVYVNHVIVCPPYIVKEEELRDIIKILAQAIQDVTAEVASWMTTSSAKLVTASKTNGYHVNGHVNGLKKNGHATEIGQLGEVNLP